MLQGCLCQQFPHTARIWNSLTSFNFRFSLKRFPVCCNLFVLLFLVTPWHVVAVQPCMECESQFKKKHVKKISFLLSFFYFFFSLFVGALLKSLSLENWTLYDYDELFLWIGWAAKGVKPSIQLGLLSEILTMANIWHVLSRIWICP